MFEFTARLDFYNLPEQAEESGNRCRAPGQKPSR